MYVRWKAAVQDMQLGVLRKGGGGLCLAQDSHDTSYQMEGVSHDVLHR